MDCSECAHQATLDTIGGGPPASMVSGSYTFQLCLKLAACSRSANRVRHSWVLLAAAAAAATPNHDMLSLSSRLHLPLICMHKVAWCCWCSAKVEARPTPEARAMFGCFSQGQGISVGVLLDQWRVGLSSSDISVEL